MASASHLKKSSSCVVFMRPARVPPQRTHVVQEAEIPVMLLVVATLEIVQSVNRTVGY